MTQLGWMLFELNIDILCANTSQAKGRVERVNLTLQARLVKELRLREIDTREAANACAAPGSSVAAVARAFGLNDNLVFQWRRGRGFVTLKAALQARESRPMGRRSSRHRCRARRPKRSRQR